MTNDGNPFLITNNSMQISPKTDGRPHIFKNQYLIIAGSLSPWSLFFIFSRLWVPEILFDRNNNELINNAKDTIGIKDSST